MLLARSSGARDDVVQEGSDSFDGASAGVQVAQDFVDDGTGHEGLGRCPLRVSWARHLLQSDDGFDHAYTRIQMADRFAYDSPQHSIMVGALHGITRPRRTD